MREFLRRYRPVLLAVCLVLAALMLYSVNLRNKDQTSLFEQLVLKLAAPLQKAVDMGLDSLSQGWRHYVWLVDAARENALLHKENQMLRAEVENLREIHLTNERLRSLLEFRDEQQFSALPARIIGVDATAWARTVVIDKGERSGVREGLPVVTAAGVVGRVIKVSTRESRVLLITDAASAVATLVQRNRVRGVARGRGTGLALEFALRDEDIQPGDRLVTAGTGGVFPKGLMVGEVTRVARGDYGLFQHIEVSPTVDFSRLEEVLVLLELEP